MPKFLDDTVELVAVHPIKNSELEWNDLPQCLKRNAEMRFYGLGIDDAYRIYGASEHEGAIAVVRPDGYIGTITPLHKPEEVRMYLEDCLATVS